MAVGSLPSPSQNPSEFLNMKFYKFTTLWKLKNKETKGTGEINEKTNRIRLRVLSTRRVFVFFFKFNVNEEQWTRNKMFHSSNKF